MFKGHTYVLWVQRREGCKFTEWAVSLNKIDFADLNENMPFESRLMEVRELALRPPGKIPVGRGNSQAEALKHKCLAYLNYR